MLELHPPSPNAPLAQLAGALFTIILAKCMVALIRSVRYKMRIARGLAPVPGPKGRFLLGILPELMKNSPRMYDYQIGSFEDVQHVLSTNFRNYVKSSHFQASFGRLLANSLVTLNHAHTEDSGAMWRLQRKLAAKVFSTHNFTLVSEQLFHKYALQMAELIEAQGGRCNMHDISNQYTLQVIFDITCGVPLKDVDGTLGLGFVHSLNAMAEAVSHRMIAAPYFKYLWWCMPSEYRMQRHERIMSGIVDKILARKLSEPLDEIEKRFDIISLFIQKAREASQVDVDRSEDPRGIADSVVSATSLLNIETLRSVLFTFTSAGWETTSALITYVFYALALYPEVQSKILEELENKLVEKASTADTLPLLSYDDIKTLRYLDAVVSEVLCVYPTIVFDMKVAAEDDRLPDGTFVSAGTEVVYHPWYMGHNNPKLWGPDQLTFRPERWLEMAKRPSAFESPVFQAGPRICPGMNMALLEAKVMVTTLLPRFHVQIRKGEKVQDRGYVVSVALKMAGGLPLKMTPRERL